MASLINAANPINTSPTVASVRANFSAAKAEIEALQLGYMADITSQRTITAADFGKILPVNSAADIAITIPTDALLGITGTDSPAFYTYQKSTGKAVVSAPNVIQKYAGFPTDIQFVRVQYYRIGVNTWAAE